MLQVRCFDKSYKECQYFDPTKKECLRRIMGKIRSNSRVSEVWLVRPRETRKYKTKNLYKILESMEKIPDPPSTKFIDSKLCTLHRKQRFQKHHEVKEGFLIDLPESYEKIRIERQINDSLTLSEKNPCYHCVKEYSKYLKNLEKVIIELEMDLSLEREDFYRKILPPTISDSEVELSETTEIMAAVSDMKLIEINSYQLKKGLFKVKIYEEHVSDRRRRIKTYKVFPEIDQGTINFIDSVVKLARKSDKIETDISRVESPSKLLSMLSEEIESLIYDQLKDKRHSDLLFENLALIRQMILQDVVGWGKLLYPLLLDDNVSEIRLVGGDKPRIHHRIHGKCIFPVRLSQRETDTFIRAFQRESKSKFNGTSMQDSVFVKDFGLLRILVKTPPSVEKEFITIRKHRQDDFTLTELILLGTFDVEQLSFLVARNNLPETNILYIGPVGTGKTTAQTTIDRYFPEEYDVEVVCDLSEIRERHNGWNITMVERERSAGDLKTYEEEIPNMLRIDSDKTIVAEILTEKVAKAFFHILAMGKNGSSTCHANSLQDLFLRLRENFGITLDQITCLDLVVSMKRIGYKRICESIDQVNGLNENNGLKDLSYSKISWFDYEKSSFNHSDFFTEKTIHAIKTSPIRSEDNFKAYQEILRLILDKMTCIISEKPELFFLNDFMKTFKDFELDLVRYVWDDVIAFMEENGTVDSSALWKEYKKEINSFFRDYI